MPSNILIEHDKIQDSKIFASNIHSSLQSVLNNEALSTYAEATIEKKKELLGKYKQGFQILMGKLEKNKNNAQSVEEYFKAYEYILEFRKFILGNSGNIDYTFTVRTFDKNNVYIDTITLGSEQFKNLLIDKYYHYILGLDEYNENLRFTSDFLNNLKRLIKDIKKQKMDIKIAPNQSYFILTNEIVGTRQEFKNSDVMRANIDFYQRNRDVAQWYHFHFKISKDISDKQGKRVFKYYIQKVTGRPRSSSVFSAIGKYFADEMTQSKMYIEDHGVNIEVHYPNAGNLTELYILAKERLNNGHNVFPKRIPRMVSGETLFELYKQVKANREPFYTGGDILMEQVKSFLGSNPSLTSYATIRNTVKNFYDALNNDDIKEVEKKLFNLLIKNTSSSNKISNLEKKTSERITQSFYSFFNQDLLKS